MMNDSRQGVGVRCVFALSSKINTVDCGAHVNLYALYIYVSCELTEYGRAKSMIHQLCFTEDVESS